jgi:hypothetical protein
MNCHTHPEVVATAVCQSCGRGLCEECELDGEHPFVACSEECKEHLHKNRLHAEMAIQHIQSLLTSYRGNLIFLYGGSAICLALAIIDLISDGWEYGMELFLYLGSMSILFFLVAKMYIQPLVRKYKSMLEQAER